MFDRHSRNGFLCRKGLEEAAQRELAIREVDSMAPLQYLDSRVSVSGLFEFEFNDEILEDQYRRFHNGS